MTGSLRTTSRLASWAGRGSSVLWWDGRSPFHSRAPEESSGEPWSVPFCRSGRHGGARWRWALRFARRCRRLAVRGDLRTRSWEGGSTSPTRRALTAHCHLDSFRVPWDPAEWAPCPLCGEDFTREHLVWECRGVTQQRACLLGDVSAARVGDWVWLVRFRGS